MIHFYGHFYDKYPKIPKPKRIPHYRTQHYKFIQHEFLKSSEKYDKNDIPIVYKSTPDSLINLASIAVDAISLPSVFSWTNVDVCRWIRQYGYPYYQNTFRVNFIDGHKLLLIDAKALSAMNIKNFQHIQHIAYGIRSLYYFEMTKFMHSISLPPEYWHELYKLFRTRKGPKYEDTRRSDLWRQMQLLRPKYEYIEHWKLLERWLAMEPPKYHELFGGIRHARLYRCKPALAATANVNTQLQNSDTCECIWPCECQWTKAATDLPKPLSILRDRKPHVCLQLPTCKECYPICICNWPSSSYQVPNVLTVLKDELPQKYGRFWQRIHLPEKRLSMGKSFASLNTNRYSTNINRIEDDKKIEDEEEIMYTESISASYEQTGTISSEMDYTSKRNTSNWID